jgi:hypothetical protein
MAGTGTAAALRALSQSLGGRARQRKIQAKDEAGTARGIFRPVDYARRTRYRRPPQAYLRF